MSLPIPLFASAAMLVLFTAVASVDGLYYHLYRYRLYARPESRLEHRLHTANSLLFVPLTFLLYCVEPHGACLWLALLLALVTLAIESADVLSENRSRASLGGLTSIEYYMHFLMSALRFGALTPLFVSPPVKAWSLSASHIGERPLWMCLLGWAIVLPGVGIAALHVVLDARGAHRQPLTGGVKRSIVASGAPPAPTPPTRSS